MPCFGKTYCYIWKTIHSVRVFRCFLLWSCDIPNMGVVRNIWRKGELNKHGKLWCSLDFRSQKRGFWDFLSNRQQQACLLVFPLLKRQISYCPVSVPLLIKDGIKMCQEQKKRRQEAIAECLTDVVTTFWCLLWSIIEQTFSNKESTVHKLSDLVAGTSISVQRLKSLSPAKKN